MIGVDVGMRVSVLLANVDVTLVRAIAVIMSGSVFMEMIGCENMVYLVTHLIDQQNMFHSIPA